MVDVDERRKEQTDGFDALLSDPDEVAVVSSGSHSCMLELLVTLPRQSEGCSERDGEWRTAVERFLVALRKAVHFSRLSTLYSASGKS